MVDLIRTDVLVFLLGLLATGAIAIIFRGRPFFSTLRRVAVIDAFEEGTKLCAERGKWLFLDPGYAIILEHAARSYFTAAILAISRYLAKCAGPFGVKIVSVNATSPGMLMTRDVVQQGYMESGHPEVFTPDTHIWSGQDIATMMMAEMSVVLDYDPGAQMLVGAQLAQSSTPVMEQAVLQGAFVVAAQIFPDEICTAALNADYILLPDEFAAAGAYLSKEPIQSASTIGIDLGKFLIIAVMMVIAAAGLVGVMK